MLQIVTLLPLLAPTAPAPTPARDLLSALPENTFLAVHAKDPRALVASRETNDWIAFAMDPEWDAISGQLLKQFDAAAQAEEMTEWRQLLFRALADSTGFVAFVGEGFGDGDPVLGILAEGGEDASALLRTFLGSDATPLAIAGGREVLISESGRGEIYYEADGVILVLSTPTVEIATRLAAECLDGLEGAAPRGPFAVAGVAEERLDADLELAVDMSQLWGELARVERPNEGIEQDIFAALASMEWMYGAVSFGEGEQSDWTFVVPYGEETLLGGLLGHFGEADASLLGAIPATASTGTVIAFDVSGCTDWVMGLVREASEEAYQEAQSALGAVTEMGGFDLMGDLVHNMSGQFLWFTAPSAEQGELLAMAGMQASTLVASVEDTDPLLDMIELLIDMSGMGAMVDTETVPIAGDEDGLEVWRMDPGIGTEIAVATGAKRLAFSTDPEGFEAYLARAGGDESTATMLADQKIAAAAAPLSGSMITVQTTSSAAEALRASMAGFESIAADLDPGGGAATGMRPALDAVDRIAALMDRYFDGTVASQLGVSEGRIRYVTRTR